ncbi:MAG: EamA family transporter [Bacteroidetes bacterium CG02_land_8_20_14_3_00_31_25]|nr:MAG: EamA family transporter [Bacteroidetes bacterium CG02_land_8_20_14_3_00_31_25]PIY04806.1 MAG: EamA family transporter [Bacteroidetes bacterium CG_4_10_14_3_um_filter_31_20]
MKNKRLLSSILLVLAAIIWGFAFVAQKVGMEFIGPFLFNGIRFIMGSLILIPVVISLKSNQNKSNLTNNKKNLYFGILLGIILFLASSAQQIGMVSTTAGNAGFITGLYVIFVPIFGIMLKQFVPKVIWPAASLAIAGFYLLSVKKDFTISDGDIWVFLSAILWAIHVLLIGHLTKQINPITLALQQFLVCGTLSFFTAFLFEEINFNSIILAWIPLLYGGILSVGVAFTLQVVGQKHVHPSSASLILSAESLFAAIGGWLLLNEQMSLRAIFGCALILTGIILVQVYQHYSYKKLSLKKLI